MKILADRSLPLLSSCFGLPFQLTEYSHEDDLGKQLKHSDILLCRSTLQVGAELLKGTPVKIVGTASAGVDHIRFKELTELGIQIFDARGCNAWAVSDYVLSTLAWLHQAKMPIGIKAGVIGMGHVGTLVAKRLSAVGMKTVAYDPPKALDQNGGFISASLDELLDCSLITIHANLHDEAPYPSRNLINAEFLKQLNPNTVILNASRGGIVDEEALMQSSLIYCTDVYLNEPNLSKELIEFATLCTPHIAGHTIEAKHKAVKQLASAIHQYFQINEPESDATSSEVSMFDMPKNWVGQCLNHYNPQIETSALKASSSLRSDFLRLRNAHLLRHDFINNQPIVKDALIV